MTDIDRQADAEALASPRMIPDEERRVHLTDTLTAYVAVDRDGAETLWLFDDNGDEGIPPTVQVAHESLGRLPKAVRYRINPCTGTVKTRNGRPCSNPALDGTDRCASHPHG